VALKKRGAGWVDRREAKGKLEDCGFDVRYGLPPARARFNLEVGNRDEV
jgi:hypothetical protein